MVLRQAPQLYFDPLDTDVGNIEVSRTITSHDPLATESYARHTALLINRVLKIQLADSFTADEIDLVSDPKNKEHIEAQSDRLRASAKGDAVFVNARLLSLNPSDDPAEDMVGIGYMTFEDRRSAETRRQRPNAPASRNLVVIRGLYVLADYGMNMRNLQHHGIGSSMLHYMLEGLDPNMPIEALDYSEINPTIVPVLEDCLGLEPVRTIKGHFAGKPAKQMVWGGRNVGEILHNLEDARPWQAESVPLRRGA